MGEVADYLEPCPRCGRPLGDHTDSQKAECLRQVERTHRGERALALGLFFEPVLDSMRVDEFRELLTRVGDRLYGLGFEIVHRDYIAERQHPMDEDAGRLGG